MKTIGAIKVPMAFIFAVLVTIGVLSLLIMNWLYP